jgi:hypothetical protein
MERGSVMADVELLDKPQLWTPAGEKIWMPWAFCFWRSLRASFAALLPGRFRRGKTARRCVPKRQRRPSWRGVEDRSAASIRQRHGSGGLADAKQICHRGVDAARDEHENGVGEAVRSAQSRRAVSLITRTE